MAAIATRMHGRRMSAASPVRRALALLAVLLLLGAAQFGTMPAFSCTAPGGGEPGCGGAGPASVGGGGSASVMVGGGNPINLLSGNKYQEETDLPALPGVLGLELKRYYNSESSYPGLAGAQWRTSYETVLYDLGSQVQIVQADGRRITLQRGAGAKAQLCTSPQPQDGSVRIEQQGNERVFHWRWADGRTLSFRSAGPGESSGYPLHSIEAPTGERTQLAYNPLGDLVRVTDPQGRQLVLGYGKAVSGRRALLQTATTPLSRIAYRHDDQGRLTEVAYSASASASESAAPHRTRLYHYESAYNAGNTFALTGISDRLPSTGGQASTQRLSTYAYDTRGRAILSTRGLPLQPGKAGTGVGQITLQYLQAPSPNEGTADRNGEVQPRPQGLGKLLLTNSLGQTSTLLTAIIGGQLRLIEFTGAGCSSCGPANRRYAYDSAGRLLRTIELDAQGRPTQAQLQRYDAAGRIVQVSEQAYRDGVAAGGPQPLRRYDYADATTTRPAQLTERSVIAGKERSTRLEYNEFGQLTRLVQAGWSPVDAQGGLVAQGVPLSRTTVYRYTVANGHSVLAEIDGRAVPRAEAADATAAAAPVLHTPDPMAAVADPAATDDMAARQRTWRDADGAAFLRATWGGAGTAEEGLVVAWEAGARRAERRFDDLQRLVAVRNPGEGWRTAVYDAADRLALTRDPRGATQRLRRGADGELQRLEQWDAGASSASAVTEWRRDATGLREVSLHDADGTRRTQYERDAQGSVIAETLRIEPAGALAGALPGAISLSLRYERGADGRIEARTLVDQAGRSSRWTQSYDERGLVSRMDTRGAAPAWLGGSRPLLREVEWAAPAQAEFASRLLYGDGTQDRFGNPAEAPSRPTASAAPSASADASLPSADAADAADAAGLPATAHTDVGALQLGWNAAAQLVSVRRADGSSRYVYDAMGRRVVSLAIGRDGSTAADISVYEESRLVAQADAAGNAQRAYVYLGLRPVAQLDLAPQGGWAKLLATWRGAPALQLHTDPAGRVVSASRDGQTLAAALQPLRDVGQRHDADTGLAYHGARFLNPRTGRFLSPDPQGIADAVQGVTRPLLLDAYAYAGGRPDLYIDPDGAARIRYFAITTGANGRALGDNQGFTKARWAFIIDQVGGGGDASTALGRKRNEYAANGTGLLLDKEGDFLAAGKSSETWTGGSAGVPDLFTDHYGNHLISVPAFTINNFDDDRAASVIASLIPADRATVFPGACPAYSLLLPPIHFAAEQTDIDVTRTDPARKQRILACGAGSATSLEQRRISTYEAAAELNETGRPKRINKDCSADGCPGVYYSCNATRCVGTNGAPAGGGTSYVASYGRSQFIGATIVTELINAYGTFTAAERTALGMGPTSLADLNAADTRGRNLLRWFNTQITAAATYAAAGNAWNALPAARRALFTAETGLGEQGYEDIVRLKTSPPTNSNGTSLLGDARQAMVTAAILSDATMNTLLMGIFQDFDRFTVMGRKLMQNNLTRVLAAYPAANDEEVAARVARLHNGGNWRAPLATLTGSGDSFNYVQRFLGDIRGEGEWRSLRCVEDFGTGVTTVAPGTAGSGVGGLEMKTLTIP